MRASRNPCFGHFHSPYESGPTTCMAHPKVLANIRAQIKSARVLSAADARLATLAGLLGTPAVGRTGFNDGVIYPPSAGPAMARALQPTRAHALAVAKKSQTLNCLVLLVDFSNNKGTTPPAHFQKLLFDAANPDSMCSFYKDLSHGMLNIQGTVTAWIRAKNSYSFYTAGQSGTGSAFPQNTPGLLTEVLNTYCASNSLKPFDMNGDGFVDGLFLVHAGGGAEAEPNPAKRKDMIWSHKWTLPTVFVNNGVSAYAYFTAPEDGRLGVFSHEFGHFLGLPDLYDTSYRSRGVGDWCLMAGGSWNGSGNQPARMSAWCLETLGWAKPKKLKRNVPAVSLSLKTLEQSKTAAYRIPAGPQAPNEYFLLENRQQTGRDSALPGKGLAVWHIDDTQSDNTNPLAYRVALIQADGKRDLEFNRNDGDGADLFPGTGKVTSVSDTNATHPHLRTNSGSATGISVTQIKEAAGIVQMKVKA